MCCCVDRLFHVVGGGNCHTIHDSIQDLAIDGIAAFRFTQPMVGIGRDVVRFRGLVDHVRPELSHERTVLIHCDPVWHTVWSDPDLPEGLQDGCRLSVRQTGYLL